MIRFYRPADAGALLAAALESVAEVEPWLPWCHAGISLADVRQWLEAQVAARQAGTAYEHAIVDSGGRYLGGCGINCVHAAHRFANLGYWVRSSATGGGVAAAAVAALVHWAFSSTELQRLEIVCAVGNLRSQRVAEKAGAQREGILRSRLYLHGRFHDAVLYSIVRPGVGKE